MAYSSLLVFLVSIVTILAQNNSTDIESWPSFNETDVKYSGNITEDLLNAKVLYVSGKGVSSASLSEINSTIITANAEAEILTPLQYNLKHKKKTRKDKLNEAANKHGSLPSKATAILKSSRWAKANFTAPQIIKPSTGFLRKFIASEEITEN